MKKSIIVFLLCLTTFRGFTQSVNTYQYDQQNRLKRTTYTNGSETQYTYDALDRRFTKQTSGVPVNCIIVVASNPNQAGTISGSGNYLGGSTCSLTATASNGYTFLYWTENGLVVSSDATYSFMVSNDRTLVANFKVTNDTGALNGVFSVSDSTSIVFSQGNLQYQASTGIWRFADNQYDNLGADNHNISPTYEGWIDLFAWGTSGYNHGAVCYMPWSTSGNHEDYYAYGSYECHLNDQTGQADWGYNAISNGGNTTNTWRTLTKDEWDYLLNKRNTVSGIRFTQGRVNGIRGIILLPDNWNNTVFAFEEPNGGNYHINHTQLTLDQWILLEQHGAVFLPYTGILNLSGSNASGFYWSATSAGTHYVDPVIYDNCYGVGFSKGQTQISESNRSSRSAVRLVRSPELYSYEINATSYPMEGGSVVGSGSYQGGSAITLRAIPNEGYFFLNWTENGKVVSTAATDRFYVNGKRTLTANFSQVGGTGVLSGVFSVGENSWVNFSQGNLQYQASSNTWRFATNQYDFMGEDNCNISPTYTGWIDLFGWGTSGYNHGAVCYQPWSTSVADSNYYVYGNEQYELFDQTGMADWGYNAISNGGNTINTWRTPTENEFKYLLFNRDTPSGSRFAMAKVNGVCGLILLPDDWSNSYYPLNNINSDDYSFDSCGNFFSADEWSVLEVHGAVFLPLAGYRIGTAISDELGVYATSNRAEWLNGSSCVMGFGNHYVINGGMHNHYGRSVRLVCPARNKTFCINANSDPADYGKVSFVDSTTMYHYGETANLVAEANTGYSFLNWTKDGEVVHSYPAYRFTVTESASYTANFVEEGTMCYVVFNINDEKFNGSYGNSTLEVTDSNGTTHQLSVNHSSTASYTLPFPTGEHVILTWIHGSSTASYSLKVSYQNGEVIYDANINNDSFLWEFDVDCNNTSAPLFSITGSVNPVEGGTVTGYGVYNLDQTCSLTATPKQGYVFLNWSSNGEIISASTTYSFIVTEDKNISANFASFNGTLVGSGEGTYDQLPSYSGFKYSLSQQIYTVEELGSEGVITAFAFFNGGAEKTRTLDFYMKFTEKSRFSSYTDWEVVTEADKVFSGTVTLGANNWAIIPLSNPFIYDGVSNIVIVTDDNTGTATSAPHMACRVFDARGQAISCTNNYTDYDPSAPTSYQGTTKTMKNQLRFVKEPFSDCMMPTTLTATEIGPDYIKLSWNENGTSEQWYVICNGNSILANTNQGFVLNGLEPETVYTIAVRPACDENLLCFPMSVATLPTCPIPTDLCVNNTTSHSAELSWTAFNNESVWTIYYKKSSDATYTEVTGVTDNPYTLDGLSASTNYQYYVVANCSPDDESQPSALFGFKTLCGTVTFPWSENFEGFDANTVPDCWDNTTSTSTTLNDHPEYLWGIYSYNGNKMLRMNNYYVNNGALINSPTVELPAEGDFDLKFNYSHTATCGEFTVKISENGGTTFVDLASFSKVDSSPSYSIPGEFLEANIPLTDYAGKTVLFQFYADANYGSGAIFVDNIEVHIAPTCRVPSGLYVSNTTTHSVELSWTANSDESEWTIYYKKSTDATYTEVTGVTNNPYTLDGLSASTNYQYYVVANCSPDDESQPSAVFGFKTLCDAVTFPWSENFEGFDANTVPDCWDNSTSTSTTLNNHPDYLWGVYSYNGNKMLRMNNYYVNNGVALINSPMVELPYEGDFELKFNYSHTATCGEFTVKISENGGTTFVDLASFSKVGSSTSYTDPGQFSEANIPLTGYAGKTVMFQFYSDANYGSGAIFVDNIEVRVPPTCLVPSGLCVNTTTAHSAELSWTANSSESEWTIYYKKNTDATYTEVTGVTENPYTLTGLEAASDYIYYLVANCSVDDASEPSAEFNFNTECETFTIDANHSFINGFDFTWPPSCWEATSSNASGSTGSWSKGTTYHSGTASAYSGYYGDIYLIMPDLQLDNNLSSVQFLFWSYYTYLSDYGKSSVVLLEGDNETELWTPDVDSLQNRVWYETNIDLSDYIGQTLRLAFKFEGNNAHGWYIDDIVISAAATTTTQTINLLEGWNWVSTYIEMQGVDGLAMLKNSLGSNGLQIKQGVQFTEYDAEWNEWFDSGLTELSNDLMYLIHTATDCTVTLEGSLANPSNHPITINPGWNWIGFPYNQTLTFESAIARFLPADHDLIQHGVSFSEYDAGWEMWLDSGLTHLVPGKGYLYNYHGAAPQTLIFQTGSK